MTFVLEGPVRALSHEPTYPSKASSEERKALDRLASEIEGAMIFTRRGRIKKVTIGDWREVDLGEGTIVRWGPLGQRIAVLHDRALYVMNADGSERRRVIDNGLNGGCSIEFHTNGREILYITRDDEVWAVDIVNGKQRNLKLPFDTELNISADGRHLVGRQRDNYCVELPDTQMSKFANGCSPCVSPDGQRITGNKGGHRTMDIRQWNGERLYEINARDMQPDGKWDNMHWSNHNDFIAMQGDGKQGEAYAFRISENQGTRLTWEGRTHYCDLFVSKDLKTGEDPREMTVAWAELNGDNRAVVSVPKPERKQEAAPKKSDESREVASSGDAQGRAAKVREVTGGPTRVVWAQKRRKSNNSGERFRLVGFGTEDGKGERVILSGSREYAKPVFTPDGNQVVYSNRSNNKMYVVNWDGSGHKEIGSGFASDVWRDPATGIVWLYYRAGDGKQNGAVMRQQLDNPNVREKIWDKTPTGAGSVPWFRLSADGTHFADAFPYSKCGVGDPINEEWEHYSKGCWPSLAPDNSYRFFVFRGNHREVAVYDAGKKNPRNVDVAGGPGIKRKDEMYYPRWSNDARFLTVTGPRGSDKEAIFLGRFNSNFTKTEEWVKISQNDDQDSLGDAWTESGWLATLNQKPTRMVAQKPTEKLTEKPTHPEPQEDLSQYTQWPGNQKNLLFFWENNNATNQISLATNETGRLCQAVARGKAVFGRFYEMDLSGGAVLAQDVDSDLLKACKGSNELTIETTITPYNKTQDGPAHIISFSNDSNSHNFVLGQKKDTLFLSLQTGQQDAPSSISLCEVQVGQPIHLVTTYQPGQLTCYVNGKRVHNSDRVQGNFGRWKPMHLLFGDAWNGGHDWSGAMEGVAIYARAILAAEAKHKYALVATRLHERQPIDRLEIEGKLVEITPMPTVKDLKEYSRGMVVYSYEVLNVLKGNEQAPKIQVQHWAILDRELLPEIGQRKVGQVYKLQLESYDKHAQLESERSYNDCEDFDIPLYYDIAGRGAVEPLPVMHVAAPKVLLKVNCGGSNRNDWVSDDKYAMHGGKYKFSRKTDTSAVIDPAPVDVYQTVRHQSHSYNFNVPDADYLVRLHFTDDHDPQAKIRKMDFVIENQRVLKGFNVVAAAGGTSKAVVQEIPVTVSDGNGLQIKGEDPKGGDVFVSAIEIISW